MKLWIRMLLLSAAMACLIPAGALAASRPSVTTKGASGVSPNAATVSGSLNPNGLVTTWYFQYGKTTKYGHRTTALDAGSGTKRLSVSSGLTKLSGKSTYHYRLVATNSDGTTVGADKTFKTPEAPTVSTIAAAPNPAVFGRTVLVNGFLVGPRGGAGKQVALEANPFPFTRGFQQVGNTEITDANGGYSFFFGALIGVQLRVVDRSDSSINSPVLTEDVAIRTTLYHRRDARGRVHFWGRVRPEGATSAVVIQRRTRKGGWRNVHVLLPHKIDSTSDRFSGRWRARRGVFRAVARPGNGGYIEGVGGPVRVRG